MRLSSTTFAPRALSVLSLIALASCSSTDLSKAVKPYRNGDLVVAATEINKINGDGNTDGIWIQMEKGSILKSAGKIPESQAALAKCQEKMDQLLKDAGEENISVGGLSGAGAVLTDDRQCKYVGSLYEAQLVCSLQAMNAMLLSDIAQAQAAVSLLRSRVDEASTIKIKVNDYLAKKREENAKTREENAQKYGESVTKFNDTMQLTDADGALKSAYASWADTSVGIGLYLGEVIGRESGRRGEFASYLSRAATDAKAQAWNQTNYQALAQGIDAAVLQLEAAPIGSTTYVIVEAGLAPQRQLNTERMTKMKERGLEVDLPGLSEPVYAGKVAVAAGGASHETHLVTDVALLKRNEFDMYYADMEYRAVLGKVIKEAVKIAGVATAIAGEGDAKWVGLGMAVVGAVASAAQGADLRSWDCLPYQYRVAAVPTPADGVVTIELDGVKQTVKVAPGAANIVVATSVGPNHCVAYAAPLSNAVAATN